MPISITEQPYKDVHHRYTVAIDTNGGDWVTVNQYRHPWAGPHVRDEQISTLPRRYMTTKNNAVREGIRACMPQSVRDLSKSATVNGEWGIDELTAKRIALLTFAINGLRNETKIDEIAFEVVSMRAHSVRYWFGTIRYHPHPLRAIRAFRVLFTSE